MDLQPHKDLDTIDAAGSAIGAQSIGRATNMLRLLASHAKSGAGLGELVAASGLAKPTCRRILLALKDAGLVEQDEASRRYFLGPELYALGSVAGQRYGLHRHALDCVVRLAQRTGDAAFLQVRSGDFVVCLHREDGAFPIRSHVLAAGDRHPLGVGAGSLAILASLDDMEVDAAIAKTASTLVAKYPALTERTLHKLVRETRQKGYSMNRGLLFPGSWGMGMIVRGAPGQVEACLSLAAVKSRMQPDREPQLAEWLAQEVAIVEQRLASAGSPQAPSSQHAVSSPSPPSRRRA